MSDQMLEVQGLGKKFKDFQLAGVHFTLPKGYIMGLIGPNGSGKTTIIKLILGMLKKSAGEVGVFGLDHLTHSLAIKKEIGMVLDSNYFVDDWDVNQVEKTIAIFYDHWNSGRFNELLKQFHITRHKKVKDLSKGMQMKLMLACAFSYDAKLLILDEPTSGLDPVSRDELLEILGTYIEDGEHSVLFSTHITSDLDKVADFITYIQNGQQIYTGDKDELIDSFRMVRGGPEELSAGLEKTLIGLRRFATGFEGLIKTAELQQFPRLEQGPASLDDIMIFMNKGVANHE